MSDDRVSRPATTADWNARQSRLALALVVLTCLAYTPILWAGFIWDDDDYVVDNASLRDTAGLARIWTDPQATPQYYPLVHTTFWIEQRLWSLHPCGYHVTNLLLHALSGVSLWRLLRRWNVRGAWLCAAVFAVHPVHVESVAWITERKNVLSGFWYLTSASLYWRFTNSEPSDSAREWNASTWRLYVGAFAAFVLALLSKTVACSLPAAMLLILWWRRGTLRRSDWLRLAPFFAIGLSFAWLTTHLERTHVGVQHISLSLTIPDRIVLAGRAVWFYLGKLLWPTSLTFIYPKWSIRSDEFWQWIGIAAAMTLLATLWLLRHRIGRGPLVAALFFGGTLLPALGFVDVFPMRYSFVADHFQYLASLGPIVLLVSGAWRYIVDGNRIRSMQALTVIVLLALGAQTWRQARVYRDLETLWQDTLAKNPDAAIAHNNLAAILDERGDLAAALHHLSESARLDPQPESLANLGLLLAKRGWVSEAILQYQKSLQLEPRSAEVRGALARLLREAGRYQEALAEFHAALELSPRDPDLRVQLAELLHVMQQSGEALRELQIATEVVPNHARAWYVMGMILLNREPARAIAPLERSARLSPTTPMVHYLLGLARERTGDVDGAAVAYQQALALRPGWQAVSARLHRITIGRPD